MDMETRGIVQKDIDGMYNMKNCNKCGEKRKTWSHSPPLFPFISFLLLRYHPSFSFGGGSLLRGGRGDRG